MTADPFCAVCRGLPGYAVHRPGYMMARVPWDEPGHPFVPTCGQRALLPHVLGLTACAEPAGHDDAHRDREGHRW